MAAVSTVDVMLSGCGLHWTRILCLSLSPKQLCTAVQQQCWVTAPRIIYMALSSMPALVGAVYCTQSAVRAIVVQIILMHCDCTADGVPWGSWCFLWWRRLCQSMSLQQSHDTPCLLHAFCSRAALGAAVPAIIVQFAGVVWSGEMMRRIDRLRSQHIHVLEALAALCVGVFLDVSCLKVPGH
jgi:hypothetical protein